MEDTYLKTLQKTVLRPTVCTREIKIMLTSVIGIVDIIIIEI